jgi:protein-tyrosine sulfotransferase
MPDCLKHYGLAFIKNRPGAVVIYKKATDESRIDRLLSMRVRNLAVPLKRLFGVMINKHKYVLDLSEDLDVDELQNIAYSIRGRDYRPAIFIHGVLPRSGTNYLADLLARHPHISAHPHRFWEFPLLSTTDNVMELQNDFARIYKKNAEVLTPLEFSAYLNSGLLRFLQQSVCPQKTMLFKFPFVHFIEFFRMLFPRDYQILLLRDGRDIISSSLRTFGTGLRKKKFSAYCREWDYATRSILRYEDNGTLSEPRTIIVRYEKLYSDTEDSVRQILSRTDLDLDLDEYEFRDLRGIPVRGSSSLPNDEGQVNWQPTERPASFNPIGRWEDWSARKKRRFKAIAGRTLIAAGYETNDEW